ncbi:hypothetical protein QJS10_CPA09g01076 [Acorus calamus]|uniref:Uncharacterized protein n=1 Tax=Acorus calamus TaxID=4465 RepID=A0AAV9E2I9_ACOCL|nr:hypothetical protein QJS10_CPA09g01076 [Acorus calamus]
MEAIDNHTLRELGAGLLDDWALKPALGVAGGILIGRTPATPFRFKSWWCKVEGLEEIVHSAWNVNVGALQGARCMAFKIEFEEDSQGVEQERTGQKIIKES